jgi:5'-nucleotidase
MGVIVITNDDGIEGAGLWALRDAIVNLGYDNWAIAAPCRQYSSCGHQTTTEAPIRVEQRAPNIFAIDGTPADCARLAISCLFPQVDLLVSGINEGGNLGVDIYTSGTVAAVREAAFHGVKGIAFSHYKEKHKAMDWLWAGKVVQRVLPELLGRGFPPRTYWNVNLPHLQGTAEPPLAFCPVSVDPLPNEFVAVDGAYYYAGKYELRQRSPNTDVAECFAGKVAISLIALA